MYSFTHFTCGKKTINQLSLLKNTKKLILDFWLTCAAWNLSTPLSVITFDQGFSNSNIRRVAFDVNNSEISRRFGCSHLSIFHFRFHTFLSWNNKKKYFKRWKIIVIFWKEKIKIIKLNYVSQQLPFAKCLMA